LQNTDLEPTQGAAYSPAHREIPLDLARIIAVLLVLPEPFKRAIHALLDSIGLYS
jgi:hypothetical protein